MESAESLLESLLLLPDGRKKAEDHGLEKMFDEEIKKLRKKYPHVSFKENSILGFDALAKQKPVTLETMRVQCMWIRYGNKGETKSMYLEKYRNGEFDFIYKKT
jgi:hypothetical protein